MKKLIAAFFCAFFASTVGIQKVEAQSQTNSVMSDEYNRNSVSLVYVSRGDKYDRQISDILRKYFNTSDYSNKFDYNSIKTEFIRVNTPRNTELLPSNISSNEKFGDIGHQIIDFWFGLNDGEMMNSKIIKNRGMYDLTDNDSLLLRAVYDGLFTKGDGGYDLIKNSYVIFLDFPKVESRRENDGSVNWSTQSNLYVYQLDYNSQVYETIKKSWPYKDDPDYLRKEKKYTYDNMKVGMKFITSAKYSSSSSDKDNGFENSVTESFKSAMHVLETKVGSWQVLGGITNLHPLRAKIGKKEGVKNGARYRIYYYKQEENGEIKAVAKGYVRATKVADTRKKIKDSTPESEFYQISGVTAADYGEILKQSNDWSLGADFSYRVGSLKGYYVDFDKLLKINTKGISQYAMLGIGFDLLSKGKLKDHDVQGFGDSGISFINVGLGYGVGIHPVRHIEFVPFVKVGIDMINVDGDSDDDSTFSKNSAYFGAAGMKVNINVVYPFQIFGSVDYSALLHQGETYELRNDALGDLGREDGVGFNVGLRYVF